MATMSSTKKKSPGRKRVMLVWPMAETWSWWNQRKWKTCYWVSISIPIYMYSSSVYGHTHMNTHTHTHKYMCLVKYVYLYKYIYIYSLQMMNSNDYIIIRTVCLTSSSAPSRYNEFKTKYPRNMDRWEWYQQGKWFCVGFIWSNCRPESHQLGCGRTKRRPAWKLSWTAVAWWWHPRLEWLWM